MPKVVLVAGGVLALALASCGGVADGVSPPEPQTTGPSTTIETEVSATVTVSPTATAVSVAPEPVETTVDPRRVGPEPAG